MTDAESILRPRRCQAKLRNSLVRAVLPPLAMTPRPLLFAFLLASACTPVSMIDRKIEVSAAQFQDLAVPAGFRIIDRHHESHSLSLGRYRFGIYRYLGSASVDSSVSYLQDRMRQQRWSLTERDGQGTDAQRLIFETQSEGVEYRMEYRVRRQESRTLIDVDVRTNAPPIAKG